MALPPPRALAVPTLSEEEERTRIDGAHRATVDALERFLDISLKGKLPKPGESVELHLPVGPGEGGTHSPQVLADLEARYSVHWSKASIPRSEGGVHQQDQHGRYVLTLTP